MEEQMLPSGWEQSTLREVCLVNPRRPRLDRDDSMPTSFVPMTSVDETLGVISDLQTRHYGDVKRGYTYFEENDVLFAKITPSMQNGKSAIAHGLIDGIGFGSTEFHVLRPQERVIPEWIHLFIRQLGFRMEAVQHFRGAVGQQRVPPDFLDTHSIPIPPTTEIQHRIVTRIEALLAEVREARKIHQRTVEDTEQLMDAVLGEVFSDVVKKHSLEALANYEPFITSGPRHWGRYARPENSGPLFLRVGNIGYAELALRGVEHLDLPEGAGEKRALVQPDDVLITITGTIGRCCIVPPDLSEAYINQHIALVRLENVSLLPRYLMWYVLSPQGGGQATTLAYGQTKPGLNLTQVRQLRLPVPSSSEQRRIVHYLDTIRAQVNEMHKIQEREGQLLEQVEQAILAKAFRGDL